MSSLGPSVQSSLLSIALLRFVRRGHLQRERPLSSRVVLASGEPAAVHGPCHLVAAAVGRMHNAHERF